MCMANPTSVGLQKLYISVPTGLHCLLVGAIDYWQDAIVKCGRHGMSGSVTIKCIRRHDRGKGGRSVTGVHGSVTWIQNKSVIEGMKK